MVRAFKPSLLFAACTLVFFLGCDSDDAETGIEEVNVSVDDVAVAVEKQLSDTGTPQFAVTFENNTGIDLDAVTATFRLLNGNEVVGEGRAIFTENLRAGQSTTVEAPFFDIDSHEEYECYEYDVEILNSDPDMLVTEEETYPGTCD